MYIFGFFCTGIGLFAYPVAPSLTSLILIRCFFSLGAAALSSLLTAVLADYVAVEDKGKAAGYTGLAAGLGAVYSAVGLLQLPAFLVKKGETEMEAGKWQFYVAGMDSVVALILAAVLLKNVVAVSGLSTSRKSLWTTMKEVLVLSANFVPNSKLRGN